MGIWTRLKTWFSSEANASLDKLEDPIKMAEQGIRDLKVDLDKSLQSLAEVKAIAIRTRRESESQKTLLADYETKARALLQRAKDGGMDMEEAKRLATESLKRKEEVTSQYQVSVANATKYDTMSSQLQSKVNELKSQLASWENELRTLKARNEVSKATGKINKQLAGIDSNDTLSMLNKMKDRIEQQEALAESYGDMATMEKSIDAEINKALEGSTSSANLDALMADMGMLPAKPVELRIEQPVTLDNNNNPVV